MEVDKEYQQKLWSSLPRDILNLISKRATEQSPWVMSLIDDVKCKFYHPLFEDNKYYVEFPILKEFHSQISACNYGWLLMNAGNCSISFFNPFTNELMNVPSIFPGIGFNIFQFSSSPTSSDCTIIAMKNKNIIGTEIGIINRGEEDWTIKVFDHDGEFKTSLCNTVFFEGCYYFMGDELNIGIFDVKADNWKVCDKHIVPRRKKYLYRPIGMVEDNGGLLVVYESRQHQQIYLARFDLLKMTWEKVDCLGADKVLYVSGGVSYLETIAAKGMGNKIYFPKFHGEKSVFYSLATKRYYSCDGKYLGETPYKKLIHYDKSTWIKSNYSLERHIQSSNLSNDIQVKEPSNSTPIIIEWSNNNPGDDVCNALEGEY